MEHVCGTPSVASFAFNEPSATDAPSLIKLCAASKSDPKVDAGVYAEANGNVTRSREDKETCILTKCELDLVL